VQRLRRIAGASNPLLGIEKVKGHLYEVTWARGPAIKYISHLDLMRTWERMLRRARLPLLYTQGFNPRPRLSFAAALPVGILAEAELAFFALREDVDPQRALAALRQQAVTGLCVRALRSLPANTNPPQARAALYLVRPSKEGLPADLAERVHALLAQEKLLSARRTREGAEQLLDLRPLIEELHLTECPPPSLHMQLSLRPGATARPEQVLELLGLDPYEAEITRLRLILVGPVAS
jgi:radical SAM-linked protein